MRVPIIRSRSELTRSCLRLYYEVIGLRATLTPVLTSFTKISNNQIPAMDVLLTWWYRLALSVERFDHLTRDRRDPLLRT